MVGCNIRNLFIYLLLLYVSRLVWSNPPPWFDLFIVWSALLPPPCAFLQNDYLHCEPVSVERESERKYVCIILCFPHSSMRRPHQSCLIKLFCRWKWVCRIFPQETCGNWNIKPQKCRGVSFDCCEFYSTGIKLCSQWQNTNAATKKFICK